jgi:hypothetical protein
MISLASLGDNSPRAQAARTADEAARAGALRGHRHRFHPARCGEFSTRSAGALGVQAVNGPSTNHDFGRFRTVSTRAREG